MPISYFSDNPNRPLSHAVRAGDFLFISGQASTHPESGELISDTFEGEFRRSVENLRRILAEQGADDTNLVKITAFLRDETNLAHYNKLYAETFATPRPARTTIGLGVELLKFELEAIAYLGR